jgi:hypothetical protein
MELTTIYEVFIPRKEEIKKTEETIGEIKEEWKEIKTEGKETSEWLHDYQQLHRPKMAVFWVVAV